MTHESDCDPEGDAEMSGDSPEASWLRAVLRASRSVLHGSALMHCREQPPSQFAVRCMETAKVAATLAKFGAERQRVGFVPLPIRDYLESLAQDSHVALEPVLRWAGVTDLSRVGPSLARGWARLAKGFGMDLSEALQHFRISFAELRGENAFSVSLARAASAREQTDPVAAAELSFQRWVRTLNPAEREELRMAEAEIRTFFDTQDHRRR